jgi:protein phosphatase PTC6
MLLLNTNLDRFRHGGSAVAQYLRQELHGLFESVHKSHIPELFLWIKEIGGYFKRFRGGALTPWIHGTEGKSEMDLEARATQTFFEVGALLNIFMHLAHSLSCGLLDRNLSIDKDAKQCGATASVVILHSLDSPAASFFSSKKLALTVAHCG